MIKKLNLLKSKAGTISPVVINTAIIALIVIVVLFLIYATVLPEAQTAGDSMNASNRCADVGCSFNASGSPNATINDDLCLSGSANSNITCGSTKSFAALPLSGLFSGTGVVFVIVMAALIILIVKAYLKKQ